MLVSYCLHKCSKLYISQTKNCLNTCFSLLMFLLMDFFLISIQQSLFKVLLKVERVLFRVVSGRFLSYKEKSKNSRNDHSLSFVVTRCQSLSLVVLLVVIRCITRCHSLSFVAPLVVTCCHLWSLVVFRCISRLSF